MAKVPQTQKNIVDAINVTMRNSTDLDGDCTRCEVVGIRRVTPAEQGELNRNWNVDYVNGECCASCLEILEKAVAVLGQKYEAIWD